MKDQAKFMISQMWPEFAEEIQYRRNIAVLQKAKQNSGEKSWNLHIKHFTKIRENTMIVIGIGSERAYKESEGMECDIVGGAEGNLPNNTRYIRGYYIILIVTKSKEKKKVFERSTTIMVNRTEKFEAERWAHLPEIKKNFYVEDPDVKAMNSKQVQKFREENFNISVSLCNPESEIDIPNPVHTFNQAFHNYPEILKEIEKQGFEHPTPIQCQSWPILLKGHDMIGIAQTGTGKTLAFILPALIHIVHQPVPRWERPGPTCLVLAPTRELAQQIEKEVTKYQYQNIRCVVVYGQGDKRQQIRQINAKAEIVVATPGRLNEFSEKEIINLSGVSYLVLDEADRMLDMGFEPQIRKIILDIRPDRQSVLTSATWPEGVRSLAAKLLKNPIHVVVGSLDLQAASTVSQQVIICKEEEKRDKLLDFINRLGEEDKAIVFVGRKSMVDYLSVEMMEEGKCVQSMHGDREQEEREKALSDLKSGRVRVLLATDVAARGIDVIDITYILNFDCPRDMEEYVHRIGRTGRAGRQGHACTFITWKDWKNAGKLIEILEKSGEEVNRELYRMKERWEKTKEERGLQDRWGRYSHTAQREGGHRW
ncbi:probable ATP-dependent RNA helicase DDX43 [Penaeus indicus]|uniref:probable ATP-dependent RNA helicase DDX43 n=1 Tax=Penaeus indicus TaxID=29960 RepID=UPI00300DBDCA